MVWSRLKVFWFSKDIPTGHKKRKKKRQQKKRWNDNIKVWTGMDLPAQLGPKQDRVERDCCEFICDAPNTIQSYGID